MSLPRVNVPRSSPAKERTPREAAAFESSGEASRILTTVFGPAMPRYSAVTSSANFPTGVLSSVCLGWADKAKGARASATARRRDFWNISVVGNGNRGVVNSRECSLGGSQRGRGLGGRFAKCAVGGCLEELDDRFPELRGRRQPADAHPQGPAVREAVRVPAGHGPELVERLAGISRGPLDLGEVPEHEVPPLVRRRLARRLAGEEVRGLPEDPRILHRRAAGHDTVAAGLAHHLDDVLRLLDVTVTDHGDREEIG